MSSAFVVLFTALRAAVRAGALAALLAAGVAMAAPSLLLPYAGRSERAAPAGLHSVPSKVRFNATELLGMRPGNEASLPLPSGTSYPIVADLVQAHGGGIVSWIGHIKGTGNAHRVIVTNGPAGSYAVFDTPEGVFRLVPGGEHDWLIDMSHEPPEAPPEGARDDQRVPNPSPAQKALRFGSPTVMQAKLGETTPYTGKSAPSPNAVIDVMVVYTQGFANALGANLMTRLNFLVTRANTAYADSEIAITLRLVATAAASYSDTTSNDTALRAVTPVCTTAICGTAFDAATFGAAASQRESAGADLVMLMRDGGALTGTGVAWIGSSSPNPDYMYSVVTGCTQGCEYLFIHELGHNMGNVHDRPTAAWQANSSVPPAGAYAYSFGHAFCKSGATSCDAFTPGSCTVAPECSTGDPSNFADIMSYFYGSAARVYKFSNPQVNCVADGGDGIPRPCGVAETAADSANTALSMNNNRFMLSALKSATASAPAAATLSNLSTRGMVGAGADVMIGGFVIGGSTAKTVVVRARGPSLASYGIANALANPTLQLVRSSDQAVVASNDDWGSASNAADVTASGFAPADAHESAILIALPPGAYTAIVGGAGGTTGVGVVEVFEVDHPETPLVNIATRGTVQTGANVMIGGFTLQGSAPRTVVVRARGPSLAAAGVPNALANPTLQLVRSSDQAVVATNDDWGSAANASQVSASGFAPSDPSESAILVTLDPGAYTAIVSGAGGGTGVGMVEVFVQ